MCAQAVPYRKPIFFSHSPVGDGGAVRTQVQLRLQIERKKLGPLRFHYRNVLTRYNVLKDAKLFRGHVVSVIERHDQPDAWLSHSATGVTVENIAKRFSPCAFREMMRSAGAIREMCNAPSAGCPVPSGSGCHTGMSLATRHS